MKTNFKLNLNQSNPLGLTDYSGTTNNEMNQSIFSGINETNYALIFIIDSL